MKAKELAELLLKTPDLDVYIEEYDCPDFGDPGYYTTSAIGVIKTPDGIFIDCKSIDHYPKSPSEKPMIGSISIKMKDGNWFKFGDNNADLSTIEFYHEHGYICNYVGWHDGYYVIAKEHFDDEWVQQKINDSSNVHYEPTDVDYVQVLESLDDDTWEPQYKTYSLEDAITYALSKNKD